MIIYQLNYSSREGEIKIEKIKCKETENSYCWQGTRLAKYKVNVANVYGGFNHSTVSADAYATSLDFLVEFKYQIAKKMEESVICAEKNLNNMKQFLEENKTLLEKYCEDDFLEEEIMPSEEPDQKDLN